MYFRNTLLVALFALLSVVALQARDQKDPAGFQTDLSLQVLMDRAFEAQMPYLVYIHDYSKRQAKRMVRETWNNEKIKDLVKAEFLASSFHPFDAGEHVGLIQAHSVYGFPSLLIFSPEGRLLGKSEGYLAPETLYAILTKHLAFVNYKKDMIASNGGRTRSQGPSLPALASRGMDPSTMAPPLMVGNMGSFSPQKPSIIVGKNDVSIPEMSPLPVASSAPSPTEDLAVADASYLHVGMVSRGGESSSRILIDVPGLEEYSLRILRNLPSTAPRAYGLLVGNYLKYDEVLTEVERFERLWRDRIFVFCEEIDGTLIYRVILGQYEQESTAKAFAIAIYQMEKLNAAIIPLHKLLD